MKIRFVVFFIALLSISSILFSNEHSLDKFHPNEFLEQLTKIDRFSIFFDIELETLPLSQLFSKKDTNINKIIGKDIIAKKYHNTANFLEMYFEADHKIIPLLMSLAGTDSSKCALTGLWSRHLEDIKDDSLQGEHSSFINDEAGLLMLTNLNQYGSLVLSINYCLNKVFYPSDIRLMFLNNILSKKHESVEDMLDMQFNIFKKIYLKYYELDLEKFYLEIVKEFGFYVDPYLDANIHYSIKEPYKSINDPDLIKIQEYFNKE